LEESGREANAENIEIEMKILKFRHISSGFNVRELLVSPFLGGAIGVTVASAIVL
jgi:hypothetical protein